MTRHYGHPIEAQVFGNHLHSFSWRGRRYSVYRVLATWHLQDRWWTAADEEAGKNGSSDRTYYRLDCSGDLQCDVYFDVATNMWILDRIYD